MLLSGKPSYEDLKNIYSRWFSLGGIAGEIDNKFALISLICTIVSAQRKKTPNISCYEIIKKIVAKGNNPLTDDYIIGLSIVCEDFLKGSSKFNTCGLKTAKDMIIKINEILDNWLPF